MHSDTARAERAYLNAIEWCIARLTQDIEARLERERQEQEQEPEEEVSDVQDG